LKRYFGAVTVDHWKMIRAILSSVAQMTIIPLQDVLGLDASARTNTPGTIVGNWQWKLASLDQLNEQTEKLKKMTTLYGR